MFEWTNKRGVPWVGLIAAFVTGCICFLPFPSWQSLVGLITSASVLMYAGAPLSLGVFRRRLPDAERPYRLPWREVLSPFAFVVANLIILWSGWTTDWKLGDRDPDRLRDPGRQPDLPPQRQAAGAELAAAQWLPPYLIGMGVIVYMSTSGRRRTWIPLWWDMVVVGGFSLVIYFWAMQVGLPASRSRR